MYISYTYTHYMYMYRIHMYRLVGHLVYVPLLLEDPRAAMLALHHEGVPRYHGAVVAAHARVLINEGERDSISIYNFLFIDVLPQGSTERGVNKL